MAQVAPRLTAVDGLRLQRYITVPGFLGGSVAPSRRLWPDLVRRHSTADAIDFLRGVRKKYGPRVWSWFPFRSTLLVLDGAGMSKVLACETTFADPTIKKCVLSTFTPQGVIISRNPLWSTRRRLNEDALAFTHSPHPDGNHFATIVRHAVGKMLESRREVLVWDDFSTLAAQISQQVIFGAGEYREDLARNLAHLVAAGNWGIRRCSDFSAVYRRIDEELHRGPGQSLVHRTARWLTANPGASDAEAPSQIAFWLFVMKDAIELHTVRTLALIASAPEGVRRQLLREIRAGGDVPLLQACIKEQLRLWTAIPILLRVAVESTELPGGTRIAKGQQLLVHAGFYHRDPEVFGASADRFRPLERAVTDQSGGGSVTTSDPPLYVFSHGRQSCAGQFLIMDLLKTVLAALLIQTDLVLRDQSIAVDAVPAAIDHFAMRFWRQPSG